MVNSAYDRYCKSVWRLAVISLRPHLPLMCACAVRKAPLWGINKGRETEPEWDNSYFGPIRPTISRNGFYFRRDVIRRFLEGFRDLFGYWKGLRKFRRKRTSETVGHGGFRFGAGEERGGSDRDGRLRYRRGRGPGVRAHYRSVRMRGSVPPHA